MLDPADLEKLCLACTDVIAVPHVDRVAFRTKKRIFCTLAPDRTTANLLLAPEQQHLMCGVAPAAFVPVAGSWGQQGWTTMRLAAVDERLARSAVTGAHALAMPPPKPTKTTTKTKTTTAAKTSSSKKKR
jgi:hypothetical protein